MYNSASVPSLVHQKRKLYGYTSDVNWKLLSRKRGCRGWTNIARVKSFTYKHSTCAAYVVCFIHTLEYGSHTSWQMFRDWLKDGDWLFMIGQSTAYSLVRGTKMTLILLSTLSTHRCSRAPRKPTVLSHSLPPQSAFLEENPPRSSPPPPLFKWLPLWIPRPVKTLNV